LNIAADHRTSQLHDEQAVTMDISLLKEGRFTKTAESSSSLLMPQTTKAGSIWESVDSKLQFTSGVPSDQPLPSPGDRRHPNLHNKPHTVKDSNFPPQQSALDSTSKNADIKYGYVSQQMRHKLHEQDHVHVSNKGYAQYFLSDQQPCPRPQQLYPQGDQAMSHSGIIHNGSNLLQSSNHEPSQGMQGVEGINIPSEFHHRNWGLTQEHTLSAHHDILPGAQRQKSCHPSDQIASSPMANEEQCSWEVPDGSTMPIVGLLPIHQLDPELSQQQQWQRRLRVHAPESEPQLSDIVSWQQQSSSSALSAASAAATTATMTMGSSSCIRHHRQPSAVLHEQADNPMRDSSLMHCHVSSQQVVYQQEGRPAAAPDTSSQQMVYQQEGRPAAAPDTSSQQVVQGQSRSAMLNQLKAG
jgi:hypothetical protein